MDKLMFWITIAIVAIIGIYVFKLGASMSNIEGLQKFAEAI